MHILISEDLDSPAINALGERHRLVRAGALWKEREKLKEALREANAILVRNQTQLTAEMLGAAPNLAVIGRVGVGLDNIDVSAATELGIVVIAPLEANATSVAELTLGLMLALARKIAHADRLTKAGQWDRKGCTGIELDGKTLALFGFGRIGRKVGAMARVLGMRVVVFDPFVKETPELRELGITLCATIEEAIGQADFISAHSPLTPETRRMFNAKAFAAARRGAFFLNTSRGGIVDENALLDALKSGRLGGAALDVREVEPPREQVGFEELDNVILAPHIGAFTIEAQRRTMEAVCEDVGRVLRGEAAVNFVNMAQPKK